MFQCDQCHKSTGPKKPCFIIPGSTRTKQYETITPEGEVKVTQGSEIVYELHLCKPCATGEPYPVAADPTPHLDLYKAKTASHVGHMRNCTGKKPIRDRKTGKKIGEEPCHTCEHIIADYARFPPQILAACIGE